jgi:hypothetical protein
MPRGKAKNDPDMLAMALVGYEIEKKKIDEKIKTIRAKLGGAEAAPAAKEAPAQKRRKLSAAARKRISTAQKKRWAEQRKAQTAKSE